MTLDLSLVFQAVTVGLVLWSIKGIARINGSVQSLLTWKDEHNKQDDERHLATQEWLKSLERTHRKDQS